MKNNKLLLIVTILFLFIIGACSAGNSSNSSQQSESGSNTENGQEQTEKYPIEIYTFSNGSSTYLFGVALADIINKNSSKLSATALESPGAVQNAQLAMTDENKAKHMIGFMSLDEPTMGYPPFEEPYTGLRAIAAYALNFNAFVTNDPEIKTLHDLNGKVVGVGSKPSIIRVDIPVLTLEKMGIKPAKYEYLAVGSDTQALIDGKVDAVLTGAFATDPNGENWAPNPAMTELMATNKLNYLSFDAEKLVEAANEIGSKSAKAFEIPAGALDENQTEPYIVMATALAWYADEKLPNETAKEIARMMAEHSDEFSKIHITGEYITPETMTMTGYDRTYFHPGALEYYEENNIDLDANLFIYLLNNSFEGGFNSSYMTI